MVQVISYTPVPNAKSLIGLFKIYIPEWKMSIDRMTHFRKGEQTWVGLPSYANKTHDPQKPYEYSPIVEFSPPNNERFLNAVKKALQEFKEKSENLNSMENKQPL